MTSSIYCQGSEWDFVRVVVLEILGDFREAKFAERAGFDRRVEQVRARIIPFEQILTLVCPCDDEMSLIQKINGPYD